MTFSHELEKVQHDIKLAQEAEKKSKEHTQNLKIALAEQKQLLALKWSETVSTLLGEIAQTSWGKNKYHLIEPDGIISLTWSVVRVEGVNLNYQVTLLTKDQDIEKQKNLSPNDELTTPVGFRIAGNQHFDSLLSENDLKEALISVFRTGPGRSQLDGYTEGKLNKIPYCEGEFDASDWKLTLFPLLSMLFSIGFPSFRTIEGYIAGIVFAAVGIISLVLSRFGKRFKRLPIIKKFFIVLGCLPGAAISGIFIIGFVALLYGLASTDSDNQKNRD